MKRILFLAALLLSTATLTAQVHESVRRSWGRLATRMPAEWYASDEAVEVAEKVLEAQLPSGGWFKNIPWHRMSEKNKADLARYKEVGSSIFDNNATTTEMRFLARVHAARPDKRYKKAFDRAFELIAAAQYDNGGWPMFYPLTPQCLASYGIHDPVSGRNYITNINFNDDATTNILHLLKEIYEGDPLWQSLADAKQRVRAKQLFYKGVQCILDCQIDGRYEQYVLHETASGQVLGDRRVGDAPLAVWCAQHDPVTLEPAQARAYEFPSYSGSESVGLVELLMEVEKQDIPAEYPAMWEQIVRSVKAAVAWFDAHRIPDLDYVPIMKEGEWVDRITVPKEGARNLWARFYELTTDRPIFGMYDFIRLYSLDGVTPNRRMGYGWYTKNPEKLIEHDYPRWMAKHGIE